MPMPMAAYRIHADSHQRLSVPWRAPSQKALTPAVPAIVTMTLRFCWSATLRSADDDAKLNDCVGCCRSYHPLPLPLCRVSGCVASQMASLSSWLVAGRLMLNRCRTVQGSNQRARIIFGSAPVVFFDQSHFKAARPLVSVLVQKFTNRISVRVEHHAWVSVNARQRLPRNSGDYRLGLSQQIRKPLRNLAPCEARPRHARRGRSTPPPDRQIARICRNHPVGHLPLPSQYVLQVFVHHLTFRFRVPCQHCQRLRLGRCQHDCLPILRRHNAVTLQFIPCRRPSAGFPSQALAGTIFSPAICPLAKCKRTKLPCIIAHRVRCR